MSQTGGTYRFLLCWVLLFMLSAVHPRHATAQQGFLGFPWGTPETVIQEALPLEIVYRDSGNCRYTTAPEALEGFPAHECMFEFRSGQFSAIAITTKGIRQSRRLLTLIKRLHGQGRQGSPLGYQWFSGTTHIIYDGDSEGNAYVYWYSVPLAQPTLTDHNPATLPPHGD